MDELPNFDDEGWLKQQAQTINNQANETGEGSGKPGEELLVGRIDVV
jgi:hypothetical protein